MPDLTIKDRRLFNPDGSVKEAEEAAEGKEPIEDKVLEPLNDDDQGLNLNQDSQADLGGSGLPPSFTNLVIGMATSAMIQLGLHSPEEGKAPGKPDLPSAKQIIDLLGILEEKTKGNLEETEEQLLKTILYDLRMKYVSLT
ncbi:MAG: DUF1844 domain-containing protein [Deltaproteobacteria bacterium]|nr:DUF1844 domain-containing protein [Deltaproteobacteria bacterium]